MNELAAKALTFAHETLRCGVPHFRERKFIPIRTAAHLIVFDPVRISPLYTMLEVNPTEAGKVIDQKVNRVDNFCSGDISLPDELCTTEKHYENWNKAQKLRPLRDRFPVDKGHSAGSQFRRDNVVEQSDVDTLAGVTPEASTMNQNCKGPLESAILKYAEQQTHTFLVQGPIWYGFEPIHGKLENGQWIPDALFISAMFLHKKTAKSWTWLMDNSTKLYGEGGANLREITLDELEKLSGLYLWGNVRASKFKERRNKLNGGAKWWMAGQPSRSSARKKK